MVTVRLQPLSRLQAIQCVHSRRVAYVSKGVALVLTSAVAFGSFGVPIKSRRVIEAQVEPVIIQCYKTAACFATCWLALLLTDFTFTPWGIVGGLIWVLNGIAAIVAIQGAGLGVSQAIWSALGVAVAFAWGSLVFSEPIGNLPLTIAGLAVMGVGMAAVGGVAGAAQLSQQRSAAGAGSSGHGDILAAEAEASALLDGGGNSDAIAKEVELVPTGRVQPDRSAAFAVASDRGSGGGFSRQYLRGIACAVYVGVASGSFLVPLKYANHVTGASYIVSFGIGSAIVTVAALAAVNVAQLLRRRPPTAFGAGQVALPGLLAGLLWSIGNFSGILATEQLGMALAWPLIQCQLLVSTAWGALYYREQRGRHQVGGILSATVLVIVGAVMLTLGKRGAAAAA